MKYGSGSSFSTSKIRICQVNLLKDKNDFLCKVAQLKIQRVVFAKIVGCVLVDGDKEYQRMYWKFQ